MAQKITDLSDLLPEPREVRFSKDGPTYLLPGDIPAPLLLRIQASEDETDDAKIRSVYNDILELFRVHQPDLEEVDATFAQVFALIPRVYLGAEPDPPKPPRSRGTGAARKTATTGSRTRSR